MIHSAYSKLLIFAAIALLNLPYCVNAQTVHKKTNDSKLALSFNLSLPLYSTVESGGNNFRDQPGQDLFSDNLIFKLGADYFFKENWAVTPAISFIYSKANESGSLAFVIPPPPETITVFETDYRFFSASLEPKITLFLPYSSLDFFWTAGPVISYGSLTSDTEGAPFANPDDFRRVTDSGSRTAGFGFTVSTGVQIAVNKSVLLSIEGGYRFMDFGTFSLEDPITSRESKSFNYRLDSFTPSLGIVYKL